MALDPVLAKIPGLAGYEAMNLHNRGLEQQEAQTIGLTAKLADHFREENFRRGLTPGMGNDEILQRAIRSVGPEKAATLLQGQANLRETKDSRKQIALATLSARMAKDREQLDIAGRNATTAERRAQIADARARMDAFYRGKSNEIASGRLYDDTGQAGVGSGTFDVGSLLAPPTGPVGPPGAGPVPRTTETPEQWAAKGPIPFEELSPPEQAQVKAWRGAAPAPRLEAELSPDQPLLPRNMNPRDAASNFDARDLGANARGNVLPAPAATPVPAQVPAPTPAPAAAPSSLLAKGLPPEIQALIDKEPSPKGKRAIERKYIMDAAKKEFNLNVAGGRESVFINRVVNSGNQAAADLENVVKMPLTVSRGLFGGRTQGGSLFEAGKETLANAMTTEDVQLYNVFATGFQRALAGIESSGLAPTNALMHQMDNVILKEGDTYFAKLAKLAQIRQIVEKGMEVVLANSRVDPGTKKLAEDTVAKIKKSVPFTGQDVLQMRHLQVKNPNASISDVVPSLKKHAASTGDSGLKDLSNEELLKRLKGGG